MGQDVAHQNEPQDRSAWSLLFAAWMIALLSTLGALFIGEVMGKAPCLLCWYQRIFMFPLAIVLAVACYNEDRIIWRYALPLTSFGLLIAAYHNLLFWGILPAEIQPCGEGPSCSSADLNLIGWIPIPLLSLGAFMALFVLLILISGGLHDK